MFERVLNTLQVMIIVMIIAQENIILALSFSYSGMSQL